MVPAKEAMKTPITAMPIALGSEIANINKGTNHWAATGAFKMQNGQWVETSEEEQAKFRANEVGKIHPQSIARNINRLGYGYHDEEGKFHIDAGGIMTLQVLDSDTGRENIRRNLNESAAKHLSDNIDQLKELEKKGIISQQLIDAIEARTETMKKDFEGDFNKVKEALG